MYIILVYYIDYIFIYYYIIIFYTFMYIIYQFIFYCLGSTLPCGCRVYIRNTHFWGGKIGPSFR